MRGSEERWRAIAEGHEPGTVRDVELGTARILNGEGRPVEEIRTGDTLVVEIPYRVRRRVELPVFAVSVHTSDGFCVHRTTTAMQNVRVPPLEANGMIRLRFPNLCLNGGRYRISTAVYGTIRDDMPPIDQHDRRYPFWIEESSHTRGLVRMENAWEFDHVQFGAVGERPAESRT